MSTEKGETQRWSEASAMNGGRGARGTRHLSGRGTRDPKRESGRPARIPLLNVLILLVLGGASCANGDEPLTPDGTEAFPAGTYTVILEESELGSPNFAGTWETIWTEEGELEVNFEGERFVTSTFTVDGEEVTLQDRAGPAACPGPGVYTWSFDDPELALTTVSDSCVGRTEVLATSTWIRE